MLGLIFLKYIFDAFEAEPAKFVAQHIEGAGANEHRAANILWVLKEARWSYLRANAAQPTIGKLVVDGMVAIGRGNPLLKNLPPEDYGRPHPHNWHLDQLVNLVSHIALA